MGTPVQTRERKKDREAREAREAQERQGLGGSSGETPAMPATPGDTRENAGLLSGGKQPGQAQGSAGETPSTVTNPGAPAAGLVVDKELENWEKNNGYGNDYNPADYDEAVDPVLNQNLNTNFDKNLFDDQGNYLGETPSRDEGYLGGNPSSTVAQPDEQGGGGDQNGDADKTDDKTDDDADEPEGDKVTQLPEVVVQGNPDGGDQNDEADDIDDTELRAADDAEYKSAQDIIDMLNDARNAHRRPSEEEIRQLRARRRRDVVVGGISDAVRSLSNLYFANDYAPDTYGEGMSDKMRERWDKRIKERQEEGDKHLQYAMNINKILADRASDAYARYKNRLSIRLKEREQRRKELMDYHKNEITRLTLEWNQAAAQGKQELAERKLEEMERHNKEMEKIAKTRASNVGRRGGGGNKPRNKTETKTEGFTEDGKKQTTTRTTYG